jgi:hypothetical protein
VQKLLSFDHARDQQPGGPVDLGILLLRDPRKRLSPLPDGFR